MVFIKDGPFNESGYDNIIKDFTNFELSDFQKYAIEGLVKSQHVLITAHTGSGKTLPAEFAIEYFHNLKKKVIYTSPIKALSNQKFYEFTKKFPHISFGILTGDIKFNPDPEQQLAMQNFLALFSISVLEQIGGRRCYEVNVGSIVQ